MTLIKWPVYANGYTAVAQHGSGSEEIPHIQGQRSPSKMVGAEVVAGVRVTLRRYPTSKGKGEDPARW